MTLVMFGLMLTIGFVTGMLYAEYQPSVFEKSMSRNLSLGKRVIISVDDEAYIFEMVNNKIRITQGYTNFTETPITSEQIEEMYKNEEQP